MNESNYGKISEEELNSKTHIIKDKSVYAIIELLNEIVEPSVKLSNSREEMLESALKNIRTKANEIKNLLPFRDK